MENSDNNRELKNTSYELFILLISILSLFNFLFLLIPGVDPVIKGVVRIMDALITLLFIADFLFRFFTAESKRDYFFRNWGWADLLAAMPVQQLRFFRIFRVAKVLRLLREFGLKNMIREVRNDRAGSSLYLIIFWSSWSCSSAGSPLSMSNRLIPWPTSPHPATPSGGLL